MGIVDRAPEVDAALDDIVARIAADNLSAALNWLERI